MLRATKLQLEQHNKHSNLPNTNLTYRSTIGCEVPGAVHPMTTSTLVQRGDRSRPMKVRLLSW